MNRIYKTAEEVRINFNISPEKERFLNVIECREFNLGLAMYEHPSVTRRRYAKQLLIELKEMYGEKQQQEAHT